MKKKVFKIFMLLFLPAIFFGCGIKVEDVEVKIKEALYEDYGEEFVVTNIGLREANGQKFYQARIYPEAIIGTEKEGDSYYYAEATIDLVSPNKLANDVGHSYGTIKMNDEVEEFLSPKAKELFGERIRLKTNVEYKEHIGQGYYIRYLESGLEEKRKAIEEDPENKRLEIELYVYIFDRIETDEELESRRVEVFELIQYLKKEKLFEYLQMGVIFIDERVLAPSYKEYEYGLAYGEREEVIVKGESVFLPPEEIRKEMTIRLKSELESMSENELLVNMNKIKKKDLGNKGIEKFNSSNVGLIYSVGILKAKYTTSYNKYVESEKINNYYYNEINDLIIFKNLEYIYWERR